MLGQRSSGSKLWSRRLNSLLSKSLNLLIHTWITVREKEQLSVIWVGFHFSFKFILFRLFWILALSPFLSCSLPCFTFPSKCAFCWILTSPFPSYNFDLHVGKFNGQEQQLVKCQSCWNELNYASWQLGKKPAFYLFTSAAPTADSSICYQ